MLETEGFVRLWKRSVCGVGRCRGNERLLYGHSENSLKRFRPIIAPVENVSMKYLKNSHDSAPPRSQLAQTVGAHTWNESQEGLMTTSRFHKCYAVRYVAYLHVMRMRE